jgi:hypothetical protein
VLGSQPMHWQRRFNSASLTDAYLALRASSGAAKR